MKQICVNNETKVFRHWDELKWLIMNQLAKLKGKNLRKRKANWWDQSTCLASLVKWWLYLSKKSNRKKNLINSSPSKTTATSTTPASTSFQWSLANSLQLSQIRPLSTLWSTFCTPKGRKPWLRKTWTWFYARPMHTEITYCRWNRIYRLPQQAQHMKLRKVLQ